MKGVTEINGHLIHTHAAFMEHNLELAKQVVQIAVNSLKVHESRTKVLDTQQVADKLNIQKETVVQRIKKSEIKGFQYSKGGHYYVTEFDLNQYLEELKKKLS